MVERSDIMLVSDVFAVCNKTKGGLSLDRITFKIYKNCRIKNKLRVFQVCEEFVKHDILAPQKRDGVLGFRFNNGE